MTLFFSSLPGFLALLGIPALLAIHFLQNRSREKRMSTLFLLEALAPESRSGKIWDRLLHSRNLWLQILSVLLISWVLAQPRWMQDETTQSMVFIMDDSVQMQAFKEQAIRAVGRDMDAIDIWGIPTQWVIISTSNKKKPIYNGTSRHEAIRALDEWTPDSGEHDPEPAMKTANLIAGESGITRFITHSAERAPKWQISAGVGHALNNVGIAGITPIDEAGKAQWRVAVKNNSSAPQSRDFSVKSGTSEVARETINLPPGGLVERQVSLPPGVDSAIVSLSADDFERDNALPLVRPRHKNISILFDIPEPIRPFFEKVSASIPGASTAKDRRPGLTIRMAAANTNGREDKKETGRTGDTEGTNSIILASSSSDRTPKEPILAEQTSLTKDLAWGALLIPSPGNLTPDDKANILLWKGSSPIAWTTQGALVLNWEWNKSNASRLPAVALMIRRFIDQARDTSMEETAINIPASMLIDAPEAVTMEFTPVNGASETTSFTGKAPGMPGFFTLFDKEGKRLVHGAAFTGDARDGDFSSCSTFDQPLPDRKKLAQKISSPDPLVPLWLALAGISLIWSWIPTSKERRTRP